MKANAQDPEASFVRPGLVTVLAVFTFIGTAAYFLYELIVLALPEIAYSEAELPVWVTAVIWTTQVVKTVAAVLLLGMRKVGFYIYAISEFVAAIMTILTAKASMDYMDSSFVNPDLAFDPKIVPLVLAGMSLGLSIVFIGGFATHLGKMR
jgi:energy-converting hydrogenase Eha subunit A